MTIALYILGLLIIVYGIMALVFYYENKNMGYVVNEAGELEYINTLYPEWSRAEKEYHS